MESQLERLIGYSTTTLSGGWDLISVTGES